MGVSMDACSNLVVLFTFIHLVWLPVLAEVTQNEDGSGTISFTPPTLNDEEAHSMHVPDHMKCDACTAIAYQLRIKYKKMHKKRPSLSRLPESDVIKLTEEVCAGEQLKDYGVKEVKKVKRLSGPGLETQEVPGIMQGGGKWPDRMQRMCNLYVEEFDEENIYAAYLSKNGSIQQLICENNEAPGLSDVCVPLNKRAKKTQKKKSPREDL